MCKSVYINPECLKSMSYNKALEASGRLTNGGSYVWPTDPACDTLMNEMHQFANVSYDASVKESASVIIDVDVDMTQVPLDQRHLIVSVNSQYGFTRRELEAVRAKLDGTESTPCDLSARVASSVGMIRITKAKLKSLGLSEEVIEEIAACVD